MKEAQELMITSAILRVVYVRRSSVFSPFPAKWDCAARLPPARRHYQSASLETGAHTEGRGEGGRKPLFTPSTYGGWVGGGLVVVAFLDGFPLSAQRCYMHRFGNVLSGFLQISQSQMVTYEKE